jgi:K+-transporting ATPase ATPase C chain
MIKKIATSIRAAIVMLLLFTVITGGIYPLIVAGMAQALFNHKAHGSLIERGGKVIGSELLGQQFSDPKYFWGRLSATSPAYNAAASSGSNLSPANPKLLEAANARMGALQKSAGVRDLKIPMDLVTASGSGLDPHISIRAAGYQISRVAKARHMSEDEVTALVAANSTKRLFRFWGEPRVNVLKLNLALDEKIALAPENKK